MIPIFFRMKPNFLASLNRQVVNWPLPASPASILEGGGPGELLLFLEGDSASHTYQYTYGILHFKKGGGRAFLPSAISSPSRSSWDVGETVPNTHVYVFNLTFHSALQVCLFAWPSPCRESEFRKSRKKLNHLSVSRKQNSWPRANISAFFYQMTTFWNFDKEALPNLELIRDGSKVNETRWKGGKGIINVEREN